MAVIEAHPVVEVLVVDERLSHHEGGRRFGIDRRTVKKMLRYSTPQPAAGRARRPARGSPPRGLRGQATTDHVVHFYAAVDTHAPNARTE